MEQNNKSIGGLVITEDVIAKMASVAALEVAGVAGVVAKPVDIKGVFAKNKTARAVRVTANENEIVIDIFIATKADAKITEVAEAVQSNVKNTVQNMTGSAVTKVNVHVADIDFGTAANQN